MSPRPGSRPHGQARQSQIVTTFGPGSMLELPNHSVLVGGLEFWKSSEKEIHESRLVGKLRRLLEVAALKLYPPPRDHEDPTLPPTGITVWKFPEWFITQEVETEGGRQATRLRRLVHRRALTKGKFIDEGKKRITVVPVRFVRACRRGHIGDIDWRAFIHRGQANCHRDLWIEERGTSGDLSEVSLRCDCGERRDLVEAAMIESRALGSCDGNRPWLGANAREACGEPSRLLVRTASNAYFPQLLGVISLPDRGDDLSRILDHYWTQYLQYVENAEGLRLLCQSIPPLRQALERFATEDVLREILARKGGGAQGPEKLVKQAEIETLVASEEEIGEDRPEGDFYARALPRQAWDETWMAPVERVVLVHRLREVTAQVGFTRFEALAPDIEGELEMGVRRAALAREVTWLPAIENRGEGIFIHIRKEAVERWARRPAVEERGRALLRGFDAWKDELHVHNREFPGLPFIFLHSLSHLLLTAVALECGYPASAIRERVYAGQGGYGILLYTASPDSEGTLGGLVQAGRRLREHFRSALEMGRLCSNDPVCAQHRPDSPHEHRFLSGAACHGCLLIAETSCEQYNGFLDRALVVPTVDLHEAAFFKDLLP
ncbi:MAG: DUF1998 domain-containing protein [Planctomycetes bacterium]|nr:DUF1998 domain-containing protein [Planctomycetota bacterium]